MKLDPFVEHLKYTYYLGSKIYKLCQHSAFLINVYKTLYVANSPVFCSEAQGLI